MKTPDLKFTDYPFIVPTEKRLVNKLDKLYEEIKTSGPRTIGLALKHWSKYMDEIETQMSIIYVLYTVDTTNVAYKKAQARCDELSPLISSYGTKVAKVLVNSPFRKDLEKQYDKYLFKMFDIQLKSFDDKIMSDLIEENKLTSEYQDIMGGAQIEFRGGVYNLSQLGKFLSDADRNTRKEAAIAMDKWIEANNEKIGEIYDKLVHLRDGMAKKLGFKNFVELGYYRLGRTDYNAKMVKNYRAQIAESVVPVCEKLYKKQMKDLGIKNAQYYDYNLAFKNGNPVPAGDSKYLVDCAKKMYSSLGAESKEYFNFMVDHELLDLVAKKGKAPGGYCTYFPDYKAPFIFSNFNGTLHDVNVLCHEGGHAFQAYLCSDIKTREYRNPTLESCEIHSMSMEFFAWPYMDSFFGKDAEKYKYHHLADSIEFLPYGITIDEFQHWVYEHPNATHAERCEEFKKIENAYTPNKKYDDTPTLAKGTWWLRQTHIFGSPFYYIDYTLAQVAAFQFFVEMSKNHEKAWKKYIKLCKCGGKYPFTELLEKNHLRNPFENGNVAKVIKPLEKVLKGFDTSKF